MKRGPLSEPSVKLLPENPHPLLVTAIDWLRKQEFFTAGMSLTIQPGISVKEEVFTQAKLKPSRKYKDFYRILYCVAGQGRINPHSPLENLEPFDLKPGTVCIFDPGEYYTESHHIKKPEGIGRVIIMVSPSSIRPHNKGSHL